MALGGGGPLSLLLDSTNHDARHRRHYSVVREEGQPAVGSPCFFSSWNNGVEKNTLSDTTEMHNINIPDRFLGMKNGLRFLKA